MGEQSNHVIDWDDDFELYQTSAVSAVIAGPYDGTMTVEELLRHGDFGVGAFDPLDGELIIPTGSATSSEADSSYSRAPLISPPSITQPHDLRPGPT